MKSAIYLGKKKIEIKETPLPCLSDNDVLVKDTFNKLGYKAKINTHTTSCINLFLDIYLYSEYRLIYC